MKVIIPAKKSSSRVPDKNWRPFYGDKSLVAIKIEQVLQSTERGNVYLSCDSEDKRSLADQYGIQFLLRSAALASDDTPWPDAFKGMVEELPADDTEDIAWVEAINPLFGDYGALFSKWNAVKDKHDSLVLTSPVTKFIMRPNGMPVNFMPGKWHAMSQNLEPLYAWDSACIMSKKDMLYFSYPIGRTPFLYSAGDDSIDIDSMNEFAIAQILYQKKLEL